MPLRLKAKIKLFAALYEGSANINWTPF